MLPYLVSQGLSGLMQILPNIKVERDCWLHWLGDYIFSKINAETLPLTDVDSIQYGCALDQMMREIVFGDPKLGRVYMLKANLADGFY